MGGADVTGKLEPVLLQYFEFPEECTVAKRVFKKQLLGQPCITAAQRRAVESAVDEVRWEFTLKASNCGIARYTDEIRDYPEVNVLLVTLRDVRSLKPVLEAVHRAIPYPLVVEAQWEGGSVLSIAPKRVNQSGKATPVVEEVLTTPPLSPSNTLHAEYLQSLAFELLPRVDCLALYDSLVARWLAIETSRYTHRYAVVSSPALVARNREALTRLRDLDVRVARIERAQRGERQLNRKVELRSELSSLAGERGRLLAQLEGAR